MVFFRKIFITISLVTLVSCGMLEEAVQQPAEQGQTIRLESDSDFALEKSNLGHYYSKLSRVSKRMVNYAKSRASVSKGLCWTYVQRAFNFSRGISVGAISLPGNGPDNIGRLQSKGFCRSSSNNILTAPVGSIIIYRPGKCGAHSRYGHGEVKVAARRFCSDFCWNATGGNSFTSRGGACKYASAVLIPREVKHPTCK